MQLRTLLLILLVAWSGQLDANPHTSPSPSALEYVANGGQWPSLVHYRTRFSDGGTIWVRQNGLTLTLRHPDDDAWLREHHHGKPDEHETKGEEGLRPGPTHGNKQLRYEALEINFVGGNSDRHVQEQVLPYHHNYFKGQDPTRWASDVPVSREVRMAEVYPGVDFRMYSQELLPKYDWVLEAGADPQQIRMEYNGAQSLQVIDNQLVVQTLHNDWVEQAPVAYQIIDGKRVSVPCEFHLEGDIVTFRFPYGYDPTQALTIDPVLVFSTYTGSLANNWGFTACFDDIGNVYSGGIVFDVGFPSSIGAFQEDYQGGIDMGIISYDSVGSTLRYATYIGGSGSELPQSLLVAPDSSLVILGISGSDDYPVTAGAFQTTFQGGSSIDDPNIGLPFTSGTDIVVNRLSFIGNELLSATYVGGSGNDGYKDASNEISIFYGDNFRGDVIAGEDGTIYVASVTGSSNFPVLSAAQPSYGGGSTDGLVLSFSPNLSSLNWSTYLGGFGDDAANSVKISAEGNILIGGGTSSSDFSGVGNGGQTLTQAGGTDGFITIYNRDGIFQRGTFLGTIADDQVYFIDIDTAQQVYAFGVTFGNYPVQGPVYSDANSGQFLHQLTPELDSTNWSTIFGGSTGSPDFSPTAFLVNECGNIYVAGWSGFLGGGYFGTDGRSLPITPDAFQSDTDGTDFYLAVLNRQASELLYGTFFGENGSNDHVDGGTSRFDKRGIVYQSVCASCFSGASGFPTTPNAWSTSNNSQQCNNATFKFDLSSIRADFQTNTPELDFPGIRVGCVPLEILFQNESQGGLEFIWDFGDGNEVVQSENMDVTHTYTDPGTYRVVLTVVDANTCLVRDSAVAFIEARVGDFDAGGDATICLGEQTQLFSSGGVSYTWVPPFGLNNNRAADPIASPTQTTTYSVRITDAAGCVYEQDVEVEVIGDIGVFFDAEQTTACQDDNMVEFVNFTTNGESYEWDFGDGTTSVEQNPVHEYEEDGNYNVVLRVNNEQCTAVFSNQVEVLRFGIPDIITPNGDGFNETLSINTIDPVTLKVFNRWGDKKYEQTNYQNSWDANGLPDGVYFIEVELPSGEACKGQVTVYR